MDKIPLDTEDLQLLLRITANLELSYLVDDPPAILATIKQKIAESTMNRSLADSADDDVQRVQLNRLSARIRRALGEPVDEEGTRIRSDE